MQGPTMGVFPDANGRNKIIVTKPPPMRKILGAITHQPTIAHDKPLPRDGKTKAPMTPAFKKRQASTSPNGGFFSHPAFKNRASPVPKRRREGMSPRGKTAVVGGVRKRVEETEKACRKLKTVEGKKKERVAQVVSDDEVAIASSSGAHPSSDIHDFGDAAPTRHIKFSDVVDTLPPSSPPVFAQDDEEMMMMMDLSSPPRIQLSSSPTQPPTQTAVSIPAITSTQPTAAPHTPPRHQKPRISARTLPPSDTLPALKITYDGSYPLVLGRSRSLAPSNAVEQDSEIVPVPMSLPLEMAQLVNGNPEDARIAPLPRTASHASRAHVLLQVIDGSDEQIEIRVLGQNGCKIRQLPSDRAERFAAGGIARFTRVRGETVSVEVDMYSCRAVIEWLAAEVEEPTVISTTIDDDLAALVQTPISQDTARRIAAANLAETPSPARSIHSQMTYDNVSDDEAPMRAASPSRQVKKEWMDAAEAKDLTAPAAPEVTPDAPKDIDLKALVATSLVFSGSSAISAPDLVKSILDSQPSMKSHGRESVWSVWVEDTLHSHPMFGRVDRKGKDASGKPLLPLFHYVPAEDYDQTRAAELGGLMRPLRGTQRGGGKAIDWRPVGGRRR